jgi:hypothetical protein
MRKSTALYYPDVEPPIGWLRSAGLLFDRVMSFVPADSDSSLSSPLLRFAEKTDAWEPYRPAEATAELLGDLDRLEIAFAEIAARRNYRPDHIQIEFITEGERTRIKNRVFLHDTKLSSRVKPLMVRHGLLLPKALAEPLRSGDWWIADEEASDLLLAQIADNLAARRGWTSVTDQATCYAFTSTDTRAQPGSAEGELARLIITDLIPDSIEDLSIDDYVDLRLRYEPIREQVTQFMTDVVHEDRLDGIGDPDALREAASETIRELRRELEAFRESGVGSGVRKWSTFCIGGVLTLAGGLLPHGMVLPAATAKLALSGMDKAGTFERKASKRRDLLRLMAGARDEILEMAYDGSADSR